MLISQNFLLQLLHSLVQLMRFFIKGNKGGWSVINYKNGKDAIQWQSCNTFIFWKDVICDLSIDFVFNCIGYILHLSLLWELWYRSWYFRCFYRMEKSYCICNLWPFWGFLVLFLHDSILFHGISCKWLTLSSVIVGICFCGCWWFLCILLGCGMYLFKVNILLLLMSDWKGFAKFSQFRWPCTILFSLWKHWCQLHLYWNFSGEE